MRSASPIQAYIALEKGARPVSPEELVTLASLYGRTVNDLQRQQAPLRDFAPHFRAARDPDLEAAGILQSLCEDYLYLAQQTESPQPSNFPGTCRMEGQDATRTRSGSGLLDRSNEDLLPRRYMNLAVQAYEQEKLTEGELMRFLRMDR